jgi:hypothetical protein
MKFLEVILNEFNIIFTFVMVLLLLFINFIIFISLSINFGRGPGRLMKLDGPWVANPFQALIDVMNS